MNATPRIAQRPDVPFQIKPLSRTDGYVFLFRRQARERARAAVAAGHGVPAERVRFREGAAAPLIRGGTRIGYSILPESA